MMDMPIRGKVVVSPARPGRHARRPPQIRHRDDDNPILTKARSGFSKRVCRLRKVLEDVKEGNHIKERSFLQRLKLANYPPMRLRAERGSGVCDLSSYRLPSEALHRVEKSA